MVKDKSLPLVPEMVPGNGDPLTDYYVENKEESKFCRLHFIQSTTSLTKKQSCFSDHFCFYFW